MANDRKYGRLYPERAVEKARAVLEATTRELVEAGTPSAVMQEALEDLDRLGFPPDEPLFLLRGQDELAPPIVRQYAEDAAAEGAFGIGRGEPEGQAAFDHLIEQADAMERWQPRKLPD